MLSGVNPIIQDDISEVIARGLPWEKLHGSTVLVTGASGMLPSYVVYTLLALNDAHDAGITVVGLVRNERKAKAILAPLLERDDFSLLAADVSQPVEMDRAPDWIIHGASAARPALHGSDPVATIRANISGTMNLLDLAVASGTKGFSLMSSAEVYGQQPPGTTLISESNYGGFDILNPRACYAEGKRAAETLSAVFGHQHGLHTSIARFGHIYGPGMALDDGRVQADFASNVVNGSDIVLNSSGSAQRTYTYVADAVAGLFYALLVGESTAYNVADREGLVSIRELAEVFAAARPELGLEVKFTRQEDARSYSKAQAQGLDSSALEALGWSASVPLATGVGRMVASHRVGNESGGGNSPAATVQ